MYSSLLNMLTPKRSMCGTKSSEIPQDILKIVSTPFFAMMIDPGMEVSFATLQTILHAVSRGVL
jgi:hypothetical protein